MLEVLHNITPENVEQAQEFRQHHVTIALKDTPERLYIEAAVRSGKDTVTVVIQGSHTNIVKITKNGGNAVPGLRRRGKARRGRPRGGSHRGGDLPLRVRGQRGGALLPAGNGGAQPPHRRRGRRAHYGLRVGKTAYEAVAHSGSFDDGCDYAAALAAAAADARMSGCQMPVATLCGSGNQGITATVPVIATCDYFHFSEEACLRALALSCLITIHVKSFIGRLSPICGCGMGSSIGVCAAVTFLFGGGPEQIGDAIRNVIADVSGIICDAYFPYEGCFSHGLGHSVGVEVHEDPRFNETDETPLAPGTVITVEPGVYLKHRFGVRIEDMVLVTPDGFEDFTKSEKTLIIL